MGKQTREAGRYTDRNEGFQERNGSEVEQRSYGRNENTGKQNEDSDCQDRPENTVFLSQ